MTKFLLAGVTSTALLLSTTAAYAWNAYRGSTILRATCVDSSTGKEFIFFSITNPRLSYILTDATNVGVDNGRRYADGRPMLDETLLHNAQPTATEGAYAVDYDDGRENSMRIWIDGYQPGSLGNFKGRARANTRVITTQAAACTFSFEIAN